MTSIFFLAVLICTFPVFALLAVALKSILCYVHVLMDGFIFNFVLSCSLQL